jgi:hypothetical protein
VSAGKNTLFRASSRRDHFSKYAAAFCDQCSTKDVMAVNPLIAAGFLCKAS